MRYPKGSPRSRVQPRPDGGVIHATPDRPIYLDPETGEFSTNAYSKRVGGVLVALDTTNHIMLATGSGVAAICQPAAVPAEDVSALIDTMNEARLLQRAVDGDDQLLDAASIAMAYRWTNHQPEAEA